MQFSQIIFSLVAVALSAIVTATDYQVTCGATNDGALYNDVNAAISQIQILANNHSDWTFWNYNGNRSDDHYWNPIYTIKTAALGMQGDWNKFVPYGSAVTYYTQIQSQCLENGKVNGNLTTDGLIFGIAANLHSVTCQTSSGSPSSEAVSALIEMVNSTNYAQWCQQIPSADSTWASGVCTPLISERTATISTCGYDTHLVIPEAMGLCLQLAENAREIQNTCTNSTLGTVGGTYSSTFGDFNQVELIHSNFPWEEGVTCQPSSSGSPLLQDAKDALKIMMKLQSQDNCTQTNKWKHGSHCQEMRRSGTARLDICGTYQATMTCNQSAQYLDSIFNQCQFNGGKQVGGLYQNSTLGLRVEVDHV